MPRISRDRFTDGWRTRWLTEGFALGPFAFGQQIEKQLRKEVSFEEFAKQLHEHLDPLGVRLPPSKTLAWAYEIALRAKAEMETVILAQRETRTEAWRNSETKMNALIALLDTYPGFDPERMLRKTSRSRKDSRTRHQAAKLLHDLRGLKYQFSRWSLFAEWGPWRTSYKDYLLTIENRLRKSLRDYKKSERGVVIQVIVDAIGLKKNASVETILRGFRREARKRKSSIITEKTEPMALDAGR